jgi:hypothetical protein
MFLVNDQRLRHGALRGNARASPDKAAEAAALLNEDGFAARLKAAVEDHDRARNSAGRIHMRRENRELLEKLRREAEPNGTQAGRASPRSTPPSRQRTRRPPPSTPQPPAHRAPPRPCRIAETSARN